MSNWSNEKITFKSDNQEVIDNLSEEDNFYEDESEGEDYNDFLQELWEDAWETMDIEIRI